MNLLPQSHEEFSQPSYWNTFFTKRGKKAFEWYGEYSELCGHLHKYIKPKDDILMIGCGNSKLSMDLYNVGLKNITNIDISHVVIKQMLDINKLQRPDLIYEQMDATDMKYADGKFSVILDKGTLDALMPDESEEVICRIDKLFSEITRVLRTGGRYVCISLLQEHILRKLLSYFPNAGFMFRICRCYEAEEKTREEDGNAMPVFMVIATKFPKLREPILELGLIEGSLERVTAIDDIVSAISSVQQMAILCSRLNKGSVSGEEEIFIHLHRAGEKRPRYTIYIMDQTYSSEREMYAAFIVPEGGETQWLFSTKEGRKQLLAMTKKNRLALVMLRRQHSYESLDAIKSELSLTIRNLAPPGISSNAKIPFLSMNLTLEKREVCYEGTSEFSGPFVVEDVKTSEDDVYRRLIFLNNEFVVQSEAKLKTIKTRRGKLKKFIDPGYLACEHHIYMSIGVSMLAKDAKEREIAVIGLGGGGLCTFLRHCLPQVKLSAIEIDKAMLQVAVEYFALIQDEKLNVHIADGIKFLHDAASDGKLFDAILFDVDNKDTTVGMSCPPRQFIEITLLEDVKKCIRDDGLFILNLVCRDQKLRCETMTTLKSIFKYIASFKLESDVNEVVFCSPHDRGEADDWIKDLKMASETLNRLVFAAKFQTDPIVNVETFSEKLIFESAVDKSC